MNINSMHSCDCSWCTFSTSRNPIFPEIKINVLLVEENADLTWKRNLTVPNVLQLFICVIGLVFTRIHSMDFRPIRIRVPQNQTKVLSFFFRKFLPQVHFKSNIDEPNHAVHMPFKSVLFPEQK